MLQKEEIIKEFLADQRRQLLLEKVGCGGGGDSVKNINKKLEIIAAF